MSVLFCDLVGFTAASDAVDPEDVRARIRPYHGRLRKEIERYGGTVEKFVGDAVMAVFGAPVAHEDDAERAVRAGLRILEAIAELNEADPALSLQVRVGINTGEAVVALGARPEQGEGIVTGDVVNTASRLQGAAPVDGDRRLRADVPRHRAGLRLRGARARVGEGQGGAARRLASAPGARPSRRRRHAHVRDAARRARAGEDAAGGDVRTVGAAALVPARDRRGRARRRQEPTVRRAVAATSRIVPASCGGGRAAACRTAKGSPSGRSGRS